jgi:hypothetical protein
VFGSTRNIQNKRRPAIFNRQRYGIDPYQDGFNGSRTISWHSKAGQP